MKLLEYNGHTFVSFDPVITAYMGTNQHKENSWVPQLPERIKADIILEHMSWHSPISTIAVVKSRYEKNVDEVERLLVVNTDEANQARVDLNVPGFCCNAEIFRQDYIFRDFGKSYAECQFDAIYNARFAKFKRHHLANEISNLRVLTGGYGESLGVGKGLERISALSHGENLDLRNKSVSFEKLSADEVCAEINQSRCGLALSMVEGMMQASTEYLLCGRPVVSTRSIGGRDIYYNRENCMIVNDDPESIRQGVDYWLKNPPDRKRIRRKVLSQINGYRYIYSRKISKLQQQHGAHAERPERIFFDIFLNPVSKSRRYHAPDSKVTEKELSRLLAYPETEILFKESNAYTGRLDGNGLTIESMDHKVQLDEVSAWILAQLDGERTVSDIINDLVSVYGNREEISDDVRDTLAEFIELDIVTIINQVK
jgi:hypothetical protein